MDNMIEENYVTFNQAQALKELGFPQERYRTHKYQSDGVLCEADMPFWNHNIACPTLSLVQKWLREEKGLAIIVGPVYHIEPSTSCSGPRRDFKNLYTFYIDELKPFDANVLVHAGEYENKTYEQALSAGIDKCIERLKQI